MRPFSRLAAETVAAATAKPEIKDDVELRWGVRIPMRDGVHLNATVYRPRGAGPLPVIFTLTPYIADSYHPRAYYFAQHGYIFALVDCRGRGNSEGRFEPFVNEARDGHDIVAWLARQPWCDGQVAMWGGSYAGFNQWLTLREAPPALKTIVPAAAAHAGVDFPFYKNIFTTYEMQWLTFTSGVTGNANLFGESAFWRSQFREWYLSGRPFRELDQVVGNLATHFQTWIEHPTPDAYWQQMTLTPADYVRLNIPILTITGHYDGDQPGALHFYRQHMQHGAAEALDRHYLIIGPWDHAGTRTPNAEVGGLTFGAASLLDLNGLHREWYDWTLKGGAKPDFLKQRVAYYLTGAETWKYADRLESIATQTRLFYLNSVEGQANDAFQSGRLEAGPAQQAKPDSFAYDPLDLRPAELEREEFKNYLTDQRYVLNLFGNGLVYHSAPLAEPTEISGCFRLTLWLALNAPDTDLLAEVFEILPDGKSIALTQDLLRARYRESLTEARLVPPGEILPYTFSGFTFVSRRLAQGSRLRLVVRCPNSIFLQKNYNSGGVVSAESAADARTVRVTLHHDATHPSVLEAPVVA